MDTIEQVAEDDTRLKITVRADLNPFLNQWYRNLCKRLWIKSRPLSPPCLINSFFIMAQKLWEKNVQVDHEVDIFTVGKDREMDLYLAKL